VRRSGEWEVKVMFITCEEDFLHYKFAVPASRKTPLTSSEQKEILHDILPVKDELYKEWVRKVRTS
jgi:hypothetical protein